MCVESCPGGTFQVAAPAFTQNAVDNLCSKTVRDSRDSGDTNCTANGTPEHIIPYSKYHCKSCDVSCLTCHGPTSIECNMCQQGYFQYQVKRSHIELERRVECVRECPEGFMEKQQECVPCNDTHCMKCKKDLPCTKCIPGYTLSDDGTCILHCLDGEMNNGSMCIMKSSEEESIGSILATFLLPPLLILTCIFLTAGMIVGIKRCFKTATKYQSEKIDNQLSSSSKVRSWEFKSYLGTVQYA